MGTTCIDRGDYAAAISHLQEAVRLDPTLSRNHTNLAYAYIMMGQEKEAWFHARQAVLTNGANEVSEHLFSSLYKGLNDRFRFNEGGLKEDEVIEILGKPDLTGAINKTEESFCVYGLAILKFKSGLLLPEGK